MKNKATAKLTLILSWRFSNRLWFYWVGQRCFCLWGFISDSL